MNAYKPISTTLSCTRALRFLALCITLLTVQKIHTMNQNALNNQLLDAARNGNPANIERLLQAGADLNATDDCGCTPLHFAALHGHTKSMAALIKAGADLNATDDCRLTPLHSAARGGHTKSMAALIEAGVYLNATDDCGLTPLHYAAMGGHKETVAALIKACADLNATDGAGCTPLHYAAAHGHTKSIAALIKAGANPYILDKYGWTASEATVRLFWADFGKEQLMQLYEEQLHRNAIHDAQQCLTAAKAVEQAQRDGILQLPSHPMEIIAGYLIGPPHTQHVLLQPDDQSVEGLSTPACTAQHALLQEEGMLRHALELMCERGRQSISLARCAYRYPRLHALTGEQTRERRVIENEQKRERTRLISALSFQSVAARTK